MPDPNVEAAIARVKGGEIDAYEVVVSCFQRRLRALISASCPPGVDPNEVAHRALVFAYQRLDDYRTDTDFFAWLCAISRNLLRAEMERLHRVAKNQEKYYQHVVVQGLNIHAACDLNLDETRVMVLRDCKAQLPDHSQILLDWYYAERSSVSSIAARLGRTVAAIKFQLFATRRQLRRCMSKKLRHAPISSISVENYESI